MKRIVIFSLIIVLLGAGYFYARKNQSPKLEVGEKIEDMGRDHVDDIYGVAYNSNPPTSGSHFPIWAKQGLYPQLNSDGYYIHSMEHGYVVIWYNCDKLPAAFRLIPEALAHEEELKTSTPGATILPLMHMTQTTNENITWITPDSQPPAEVQLPLSFQTPTCKNLVEELKPFLNTAQRVIIAPRINLDTKLAITSWNRLLKLDSVEAEKINEFIKTYHNKGPEQTME